jgi:hypothetical protein
MANTYHDQLSGSDLHDNKVYSATGTPLPTWTQTDARYARQNRTLNTTAPLQGGGDLSADRTLSILAASTSQSGYLSAADFVAFTGKQTRAFLIVGPSGSNGSDYTASSNASTAIQAAIDAAYLAGGGIVFIRGGLYLIGTTLTLKSGVLIVGEGYATCLRANASMTAIFYTSRLIQVANAGWRDLCLDANNLSTVSCIQLPTFTHLTIENVWCINTNHV